MVLVGLFSRTPKDPQSKKNDEQFKKFKKLVKEKKYPEALKLGTDYLEKVPNHHDVLFTWFSIPSVERIETLLSS